MISSTNWRLIYPVRVSYVFGLIQIFAYIYNLLRACRNTCNIAIHEVDNLQRTKIFHSNYWNFYCFIYDHMQFKENLLMQLIYISEVWYEVRSKKWNGWSTSNTLIWDETHYILPNMTFLLDSFICYCYCIFIQVNVPILFLRTLMLVWWENSFSILVHSARDSVYGLRTTVW